MAMSSIPVQFTAFSTVIPFLEYIQWCILSTRLSQRPLLSAGEKKIWKQRKKVKECRWDRYEKNMRCSLLDRLTSKIWKQFDHSTKSFKPLGLIVHLSYFGPLECFIRREEGRRKNKSCVFIFLRRRFHSNHRWWQIESGREGIFFLCLQFSFSLSFLPPQFETSANYIRQRAKLLILKTPGWNAKFRDKKYYSFFCLV